MSERPSNYIAHIGGVFIYSAKPKELAEWYKTTLGMNYEFTPEYNAFYISFNYTTAEGQKAHTVWSILDNKNRPDLQEKVFTVNYRVYDMNKILAHLKHQNIEVKGPEEYPEGRFAWIKDPDGNSIELWEDTSLISAG